MYARGTLRIYRVTRRIRSTAELRRKAAIQAVSRCAAFTTIKRMVSPRFRIMPMVSPARVTMRLLSSSMAWI